MGLGVFEEGPHPAAVLRRVRRGFMWRGSAELFDGSAASRHAERHGRPGSCGSAWRGVGEGRSGWEDRRSAEGLGEDGEVICGRWATPSMGGWPCWDLMCMRGSRWYRRRPRRACRCGPPSGGSRPISPRGPTGLRRAGRADRDRHRLPDELLKVIEGMALRRPPPHAAEVYPSSGQDRRRAGAGSRRRTPSSGRSSPVWTAGCWPWRTMTGRCTGTPTSWCCAGNPGIRTICGRPITPNWM